MGERRILAAVFALGVSCVTTQLAVMREMLGAFAGNELVMGVVLGNWLLLMGLGAALAPWVGSRTKCSSSGSTAVEPVGRGSRRAVGVWSTRRLGRSLALPTPGSRTACSGASPLIFAWLLIVTAVLPPAQIAVLRGFRGWLGLEGMAMGVWATIVGSLGLLLPYCLSAGLLLALACSVADGREASEVAGRVYALDSLGSVLGGIVCSFLLVRWLDHLALLGVPALLNLIVAFWLTWDNLQPREAEGPGEGRLPSSGRLPEGVGARVQLRSTACMASTKGLLAVEALAIGALGWLWLSPADANTTTWQWPGQRLLFRGSSPYGRLVVTEAAGETNLIENGLLLASIPNLEQAEETVHFAMAQRPDARRVLLIGGALGGVPEEVLRYPAAEVHCLELDPLVLKLGRGLLAPARSNDKLEGHGSRELGGASVLASRVTGFSGAARPEPRPAEPRFMGSPNSTRLRTFAADARAFLRQADAPYDVVILAQPDPSTVQLNRLFTREFFDEVRLRLAPEGVVSFAVGQYENYASPALERLLSCARRTVAEVFTNVLLIPGSRVQFLASNGPLTGNIAAALEQSGIATRWVNRHYLAAMLTPDRLGGVASAADGSAPVNRDLTPVLYYLHLRHWASQFAAGYGWLAGAWAGAIGVAAWRLRGASAVIFASGYAGASLEVVLLLGLQVLVGSLYQQVALVVTLFMAGLAVGAWGAMRWWRTGLTGKRRFMGSGLGPRAVHAGHEPGRASLPASRVKVDGTAARPEPRPTAPRFTGSASAGAGLLVLTALVATFALALPLILDTLGSWARVSSRADLTAGWAIGILTFTFAVVVGAQFPLANRGAEDGRPAPAAVLYSADFLGASVGALLTSTLLLPVIGVRGVCLLVAGLNLLAGAAFWRERNPCSPSP